MILSGHFGRRALANAAFLLGCGLLSSGVAQAKTITVTNTRDSGPGSLRNAITEANALGGSDTILIEPSGDIALSTALPTLSDVTIQGPGMSALNIRRDSTAAFRIFTVPVGVTVTLRDFTISNGYATGYGGGVNNTGTLTLTNCRFYKNSAGQEGGGLSNYHGQATINNCQFIGNSALGSGGGVLNDARTDPSGYAQGPATLIVANSVFAENATSVNGGGIANYEGALNIERTTLDSNKATLLGGGFYTLNNTVNVVGSTLSNNQADEGGGFYSKSGTTLLNCTLSGNSATRRGGGFSNTDRLTSLDSCTVSGNKAPAGEGSGAASIGDDGATRTHLKNSILAGNLDSDGNVGTDFAVSGDRQNFQSQGYNVLGIGNVGLSTDTDVAGVSASDLRLGPLANNGGPTLTRALLAGSPAVNRGNTELTTDQRGTGRPQGGVDDTGAFEYTGLKNSLVVTTVADEDDGTSDPAFGTGTSLREAIVFANSNPNSSVITFNLSGTGGNVIRLRSTLPALSTPINVQGPGAENLTIEPQSDDDMRLFVVTTTGAARISGLTLSNANSLAIGGAIFNENAQLSLSNCVFSNNTAYSGAAVGTSENDGATVAMAGCTFDDNRSSIYGGGAISNRLSSFSIYKCVFTNNRSGTNGGAVNNEGNLTITASTFAANTASGNGGVLSNYGTLTVIDSSFRKNNSNASGGAVYNQGLLLITGSTLSGNIALTDGGAIANRIGNSTGLSAALSNSTLSGNQAARGGGFYTVLGTTQINSCTITANIAGDNSGAGIFINSDDGARTEIANSIVAGNNSTDVDFQVENLNDFVSLGYNLVGDGNARDKFIEQGDQFGVSDSQLKLGVLASNGGPTQTHALLAGSPAVDKGNTALSTDQRGKVRPLGVADDIGAFETEGTKPTVRVTNPAGDQVIPANSWSTIEGSAKDNLGVTKVQLKLFRTRGKVRTYWNGSSFGSTEALLTATLASPGNASTTWSYSVPAELKAAVDAGAYTLYAYASDAAGNTSPAFGRDFRISVGDDVKPTVNITNPFGGQVVEAASWSSISGGAKDNLGVAKVQFKLFRTRNGVRTYWNGSSFGSASTLINATVASPGSLSTSWSYSIPAELKAAVDSGAYTLYAYSIDVSGNMCPAWARNFTINRAQTQDVAPLSEPASPSGGSS